MAICDSRRERRSSFPPISAAIHDATQRPFELRNATPVGGGSINEAYRLEGNDGARYFLKLNDARHHADVRRRSRRTRCHRRDQHHARAATHRAWHRRRTKLSGAGISGVERRAAMPKLLGEQLAALHRCTRPAFGFAQDNFIGTTPQPNGWKDDWIDFWREQRLGFQLRACGRERLRRPVADAWASRLLDALPAFFDGYTPQPSLLHGDLWSGNHALSADGTPTIFDPAAYYGDRECDLAMTELFGGYPADFYAAYRAAWPLDAGYADAPRSIQPLPHPQPRQSVRRRLCAAGGADDAALVSRMPKLANGASSPVFQDIRCSFAAETAGNK